MKPPEPDIPAYKVLIVDDEPLARRELKRLILRRPGFEVESEAGSVSEALKQLCARKFDLVFLDMELPGGRGDALARELCSWSEPPVVIFATAHADLGQEAYETQASEYLVKPFAPAAVDRVLDMARSILSGQAEIQRVSLERLVERILRPGKVDFPWEEAG